MTPTTCHRSHRQQQKAVLFLRIKRVCNHKIRCGGCLEQFKTLRHKAAVKQDKALNRFFLSFHSHGPQHRLIQTSTRMEKRTADRDCTRHRMCGLHEDHARTQNKNPGEKKRRRKESSKSVVKWISGKEKKNKKGSPLVFFFEKEGKTR